MNKNTGKWLEHGLQDALEEYCSRCKGFFHRFADSRAARNLISPQPADFLWAIPGGVTLIEAKSTVLSKPLVKLLKPEQVGRHRLWHRAGHPSVFVYADKGEDVLEAWDGYDVVEMFDGSVKRFQPYFRTDLEDYYELVAEIETYVNTNY